MRIVSTVPSQTELLHYLGLEEEVVGITKFCIHPDAWFRNKTRIGGTKNLHIDTIRTLKPDWILANKEENVKEQIEACREFAQVYVSDIHNLEDACTMIRSIGRITLKTTEAGMLVQKINDRFSRLTVSAATRKAAYLIWKAPLMTVGKDTFIHDMLLRNGWNNVFAATTRYPEITEQALIEAKPGVLLLSSEPYPFSDKHIDYFQSLLPDTHILLVDGTYFSWYGSRLAESATYFRQVQEQIASGF